LLGSLFVNLSRHQYLFGDYYDPGYARRGFVPWNDYRIHRTAYDPLYSYYRWQNRAQPRWEANVRAAFVDRRDNPKARPPHTLALQQKAPGQDRVFPIAKLDQAKSVGVKLAPVTKAQITEYQKSAVELRRISSTRNRIETSTKAKAAKSPVKLELPKTTFKSAAPKKAPPPAPETPKAREFPKEKSPKDVSPKEKLPKVELPKEKLPKVELPKEKLPKEKLPKVEPPKEKLPKVEPPKEKLPKVEPPKEKRPKIELPKEKLPKVELPKEKLPKVEPPKEKTPRKDEPPKKPKKDDTPKKPKDSAAADQPLVRRSAAVWSVDWRLPAHLGERKRDFTALSER
jgi:hypothetical protein